MIERRPTPGSDLRAVRRFLNLTLGDVARHLGVSVASVSARESGRDGGAASYTIEALREVLRRTVQDDAKATTQDTARRLRAALAKCDPPLVEAREAEAIADALRRGLTLADAVRHLEGLRALRGARHSGRST